MTKPAKRTARPSNNKNRQRRLAEPTTAPSHQPEPTDILCIVCNRPYPPGAIAHRIGEHTARGLCYTCAHAKPVRTWWT